MAVTPKIPLIQPVQAKSFYSFVVTIPDDDYASWRPVGASGHVLIASNAAVGHGIAWFRGSASSKFGGAATFLCVNTTLNGTTGADGNLTLGAAGSNLYLENRTGASLDFVVTMVTYEDAFD